MRSLVKNAFQVSQDYFPETMGQVIVINAPSSFTRMWSIAKPWISKETAAKVKIVGSDYERTLLDVVDAENLPTSLGGKCTCADRGGCSLSGTGPWMEGRVGWGPNAQLSRPKSMDQDSVFADVKYLTDKAQGEVDVINVKVVS